MQTAQKESESTDVRTGENQPLASSVSRPLRTSDGMTTTDLLLLLVLTAVLMVVILRQKCQLEMYSDCFIDANSHTYTNASLTPKLPFIF